MKGWPVPYCTNGSETRRFLRMRNAPATTITAMTPPVTPTPMPIFAPLSSPPEGAFDVGVFVEVDDVTEDVDVPADDEL